MRMRPSTAILLIMIAIVIRSNPDIIVITIKPVIRILIVAKTKITKEKKVEVKKQEIKLEATPNITKEEKLQQPKEVKVFPDYLTTGFVVKGGCIANKMWLNNQEILIWADHCRPNSRGKFNTRSYDSPANAKTKALIILPEPALGEANMSVLRGGIPVDQKVILTGIENCHAFYTVKNGFSRPGDSGGGFWRLINGQKFLIGVNHGSQYGSSDPSSYGLFAFCKGNPPYR